MLKNALQEVNWVRLDRCPKSYNKNHSKNILDISKDFHWEECFKEGFEGGNSLNVPEFS